MESRNYTDGKNTMNINDQESNYEERPTRKLHNFNLPGLSWANQRLLTCMKTEDIEKIERVNNMSIPQSDILSDKDNGKNQIPRKKDAVKISIEKKGKSKKSEVIEVFDDSDAYTSDEGIEAKKEDDKRIPQNEGVDSLPLKWRTRRAMAARGLKIEEPWMNQDHGRVRRTYPKKSFEEVHGRPKFSLTLSKKEIEEDFIKMTGKKPPKKPKRRPRAVQNYIDSIFPGATMTEITHASYNISRDIRKK